MASTGELADVQRALQQLRASVGALRSRYGDIPAARRVGNDLERLDIDIAELSALAPAPAPRGANLPKQETMVVPDTPYDPSLWRDADDEGVGGHNRNHH